MRISDWISDVCSSDLVPCAGSFERPGRTSGLLHIVHRDTVARIQPKPPLLEFHGAIRQWLGPTRQAWHLTRGMPSVRTLWRSAQLQDRSPLTRSEEHTSELQSLMRISYAVFCLKKNNQL